MKLVYMALGLAIVGYLLAALAYMLFAAFRKHALRHGGLLLAGLAFVAHSGVLGQRIWEAGRPPFSNMYETLLFFSWLLVIASVVIEHRYTLPALGALTFPVVFLLLAATSLIETAVQPLLPALKSNWLLSHVLTCFFAYTSFAIAFGTSVLYLFVARDGAGPESRTRRRPTLELLDGLSYRMITVGYPLLTIGIVTGSVWAEICWGTYWSWDPKETWSLVTWLIYGACLHLRHRAGWHGRQGAIASVIGFLSVIFTYFGVNYLLSGLHAYA